MALTQLYQHAKALSTNSTAPNDNWSANLHALLSSKYAGPSALPNMWNLVRESDSVGDEHHGDFAFNARERKWLFDDRMMLRMSNAALGDLARMQRLARAFFWHEYVHEYQRLTRHTAIGVGGFPNCLERIDYVADVYGILHQADYILREQASPDESKLIPLLVDCIDDAIDAFWTFEDPPPIRSLQQRRLRRYLNWYWRREQIRLETTPKKAMDLLTQQPTIEIAGLPLATDGRRVYHDLRKTRSFRDLEVGIVREDNRFVRCASGPTLSISGMLEAFSLHDRNKLDSFFEALYAQVIQ